MTVYSNNISGTVPPGGSERWVVETRTHDAVRVSISADGQPYEVDVQTGSELNFPTYESVLPLGAERFTDTNEHVLGSDITEDAVFVEVTNTGSSEIAVDGKINRHSENAESTVSSFLTSRTNNRGIAYLDGELVTDSAKAQISALVGGLVSSEVTSLEGDGISVSNGSLAATLSGVGDDSRFTFGADDDYFIEYDSTAGEWLFGSSDIDGAGTDGVLFRAQDASRITDFLGAIDMGGNGIRNLPSPSNANDAARKGYVDGVAQGLNLKEEVAAATDGSNVDLASSTDPNPIDGYTLSDGDRVLLKDQTTGSENGIYIADVATDPTTWYRAPDLDEDSEAVTGVFCFVGNGTANNNKSFVITTNNPIDLGVDAINWSVFTTAGQLTAGTGLTKSGQEFSIASGGVTSTELASGSVGSTEIADGSIATADIGADAVTVAKLGIGDGAELPFGAGDDITERYDATADDLRWQDNTNAADRMALDRTTGDLTIEGTLSEGAAL